MKFYKSEKGYYFKIYANGKRKRVSKSVGVKKLSSQYGGDGDSNANMSNNSVNYTVPVYNASKKCFPILSDYSFLHRVKRVAFFNLQWFIWNVNNNTFIPEDNKLFYYCDFGDKCGIYVGTRNIYIGWQNGIHITITDGLQGYHISNHFLPEQEVEGNRYFSNVKKVISVKECFDDFSHKDIRDYYEKLGYGQHYNEIKDIFETLFNRDIYGDYVNFLEAREKVM